MSDTIAGYESSKQAVDLLDQAINEMGSNGVAPDELVKAKKAYILASDVVSGFEWRHNGLISSPSLRVVEAWTDEFTSATHHFRTPIPLEEVPEELIELVKSADEFTVRSTGSITLDKGNMYEGEWYPDPESLSQSLRVSRYGDGDWAISKKYEYCKGFNSYDEAVARATNLAQNDENEISNHTASVIVSLEDIPEEQLSEKTRTEYLLYP